MSTDTATLLSSSPATLSAATTSGTGSGTTLAASKTVGKEDFLKLLVTQLRYQDPLQPEDPKDFVAQLAQFSSLEQQINLNQNFSTLSDQVKALKNTLGIAQGVSLLGKTVKGKGNSLTLANGRANEAAYQLSKAAAQVTVTIQDSSGRTVRTLNLGSKSAGNQTLMWDGKNDQGVTLPDGQYSFQVSAKDAQGNRVEVSNFFSGKVQEVFQDSQGVWLKVDGRQLLLDNIQGVM